MTVYMTQNRRRNCKMKHHGTSSLLRTMPKGIQITLAVAIVLVLSFVGWSSYKNQSIGWIQVTAPEQNEIGTTTEIITGTTTEGSATPTSGEKCAARGGTWSSEYGECTGIGQAACVAIGGDFDDCASACRHDPNAQVCILMCVEVCTIQ